MSTTDDAGSAGNETDFRALSLESRSNSVRQLCDLYRVVIAIAVGVAFHGFVDSTRQPVPFKLEDWQLFFTFIVTIIPFFHGAVRHLYATYVEDEGSSRVKNWAVLIDFYLLFIGGGLFVALATAIPTLQSFQIILMATLGLDIVWGVLASRGFAGTSSQQAEMKWALINFVAVIVLVGIYFVAPNLNNGAMSCEHIAWLVLAVGIIRTAVDYATNIPFYCPGPPPKI